MRRAASQVLFGVVPVLSVVVFAGLYRASHTFAFDFHNWFWPAGDRLLHGQSPYIQPYPWALSYPALTALLFVPFALLPHGVADVVFTALVVAAVPGTLWLLNVRDWRVYGIAMLWAPVVVGWHMANVTLLLVLGVAAAWRFRDRAVVTGVVVAVLVSVKLFLWPLGLWFLATRRYAALGWAVASAAILSAAAFAAIGFGELSRYLGALRSFLAHTEKIGYSLISLATHLGAGNTLAYTVALIAAGAAAAACVWFGRRGCDQQAIMACIAVSLLASPIVEAHYLALLLVPLALTRPRLSAAWAFPLALWITPAEAPAAWQQVLFLCVGAATLTVALTHPLSSDSVARGHTSTKRAMENPRPYPAPAIN